jgi:hypothetical protein
MTFEGGCYCGAVRYVAEGEPSLKAQCHCRECQYITGGGPNYLMMMPRSGFSYVKGATKGFKRSDLARAVTREFCETCGTHIITAVPGSEKVVIKVGTLDHPADFGGPDMAVFTLDMQPFHVLPEGVPAFERFPSRA